ncbi:MAG: diguanylate cyclase [Pseudomonadota bacterium]
MTSRSQSKLRFTILTLALLFLMAGAIYWLIHRAMQSVVEHQALVVAEIVAKQAASIRSVYGREVVNKLAKEGKGSHPQYQNLTGFVPVPAQFLKLTGLASSHDTADLFEYRPVSKWNIEPSQGIDTDFLRWAWPQLEGQDQANPSAPIDWRPAWRIEKNAENKRVLRYLWADPASDPSCVECHNAYEQRPDVATLRQERGIAPGKQWQLHQLMGALDVTIPLDKVEVLATEQMHQALGWIAGILLLSSLLVGLLLMRSSRHQRRLEQLSWDATHDPLTGFYNRRGLDLQLERFWYDATMNKKHHALCLIDLDGFKAINDTSGHDAGDALLKHLGRLLPEQLRESDVIARLGGDEFAVILEGCPLGQATNIAEIMRKAIEQSAVQWKGQSLRVTASIGLAVMDQTSASIAEVMSAADAACYRSKSGGKNLVTAATA